MLACKTVKGSKFYLLFREHINALIECHVVERKCWYERVLLGEIWWFNLE